MGSRPSSMREVPQLDFTTLAFAADMASYGGGFYPNNSATVTDYTYLEYSYEGPSQLLEKLTISVISQDVILPIGSPEVNASWDLEFYGPSLRCCDSKPRSATQPGSTSGTHTTPRWSQGLVFQHSCPMCPVQPRKPTTPLSTTCLIIPVTFPAEACLSLDRYRCMLQ